MTRVRLLVAMMVLGVAAFVALSCGSGRHVIQSLAVSPGSADAKNYPGGKVPFVATGTYNSSPMTITPQQANWAAVSEVVANGMVTFGPVSSDVSVDQSGVAQCTASASGTYGVIAWDLQDPSLKATCASETDFGEPGCNAVQGTGQLTCP
jgi:hypothetical protein